LAFFFLDLPFVGFFLGLMFPLSSSSAARRAAFSARLRAASSAFWADGGKSGNGIKERKEGTK
jgi:hypothetical protein